MYIDIHNRLFDDIHGLGTDFHVSDRKEYIPEHRKALEELTKRIYVYLLEDGEDPYEEKDFYTLNMNEEWFSEDEAPSNADECDQSYPMYSLARSVINDFDFTNAYQKNGYYIIRILNHIFMMNAAVKVGQACETKVIVKTKENQGYWFDDYLNIVGCSLNPSGASMVDTIECLEKIDASAVSEDMRVIIWCLIRLIYCLQIFDADGVITP